MTDYSESTLAYFANRAACVLLHKYTIFAYKGLLQCKHLPNGEPFILREKNKKYIEEMIQKCNSFTPRSLLISDIDISENAFGLESIIQGIYEDLELTEKYPYGMQCKYYDLLCEVKETEKLLENMRQYGVSITKTKGSISVQRIIEEIIDTYLRVTEYENFKMIAMDLYMKKEGNIITLDVTQIIFYILASCQNYINKDFQAEIFKSLIRAVIDKVEEAESTETNDTSTKKENTKEQEIQYIQLLHIDGCGRKTYFVKGLDSVFVDSMERCAGYVIEIKNIYNRAQSSWTHYKDKILHEAVVSVASGFLMQPQIAFQRGHQLEKDIDSCIKTMQQCYKNLINIWNNSIKLEWTHIHKVMQDENIEPWLDLSSDERWKVRL